MSESWQDGDVAHGRFKRACEFINIKVSSQAPENNGQWYYALGFMERQIQITEIISTAGELLKKGSEFHYGYFHFQD